MMSSVKLSFFGNSGLKLIAYIIHQNFIFLKYNLKITSIIYYIIHQLPSKQRNRLGNFL